MALAEHERILGRVHSYDSFARALVADALRAAIGSDQFEPGTPIKLDWTIEVVAIPDHHQFCIGAWRLGQTGEPAQPHFLCRRDEVD